MLCVDYLCDKCVHARDEKIGGWLCTCDAFPDGIPPKHQLYANLETVKECNDGIGYEEKLRHAMKCHIIASEGNLPQFDTCCYTESEKERILSYLKSFEPFAVAGMVYDCVTGERTGIENVAYTDGIYLWSAQDIYHFERYNAALVDDFVARII